MAGPEGLSSAITSGAALGKTGGGPGAAGEVKTSVGFGAIYTGGNAAQAMTGNFGQVGGVMSAFGNPLAVKSAGAGGNLLKADALLGAVFLPKGEGGPRMGDHSPYQAFASAGADFGRGATGGHDVPMASLGGFAPTPTPGIGRSQEMGMGA